MSTESLREVRDHFSEVVDRVAHEHERVTVTRNGRPAAVILRPDDLAQLEETLEILSDPDALADIREADTAYRDGHVVRGVEAVHWTTNISVEVEPSARDRMRTLRARSHPLPSG